YWLMILVSGASDAMVLGPAASPPAGIARSFAFFCRRRRGPFLRTAKSPDDAPRRPENAMSRPVNSGWHFAQHFQASDTRCNLAQSGYSRFVFGLETGLVALCQFACAVRG